MHATMMVLIQKLLKDFIIGDRRSSDHDKIVRTTEGVEADDASFEKNIMQRADCWERGEPC